MSAAPEEVVTVFDWCRHGSHLSCPGVGINQYRRLVCRCTCHGEAA